MGYVPDDILIEILSGLPVKSILRFKRVCKSWYALLSHPHFVSKHLAIQNQSHEKLMLLKQCIYIPDDPDDPDYDAINGTTEYEMFIVSKKNMHDPESFDLPISIYRLFDYSNLVLIGQCDGLIAISNSDKDIIVCNPATGDFRILPDSCLRPPHIPCDASIVNPNQEGPTRHRDSDSFIGFGYDKATKDHKIVRVVTFSWLEGGVRKFMHKAEVFCIGTNFWRELNVIFHTSFSSLEEYKTREPYIDGVYYWLAQEDETGRHVLISFHMADELFGKIPIRKAIRADFQEYILDVSIGVYNDSIALYIHIVGEPDWVEIWAMKEIGVEVSWSKQLTVNPFIGSSHFVGFWNGSDKEYFYIDEDTKLAIYNRDTTESKTVKPQNLQKGMRQCWEAVPYMRTIVSVQSKEEGTQQIIAKIPGSASSTSNSFAGDDDSTLPPSSYSSRSQASETEYAEDREVEGAISVWVRRKCSRICGKLFGYQLLIT